MDRTDEFSSYASAPRLPNSEFKALISDEKDKNIKASNSSHSQDPNNPNNTTSAELDLDRKSEEFILETAALYKSISNCKQLPQIMHLQQQLERKKEFVRNFNDRAGEINVIFRKKRIKTPFKYATPTFASVQTRILNWLSEVLQERNLVLKQRDLKLQARQVEKHNLFVDPSELKEEKVFYTLSPQSRKRGGGGIDDNKKDAMAKMIGNNNSSYSSSIAGGNINNSNNTLNASDLISEQEQHHEREMARQNQALMARFETDADRMVETQAKVQEIASAMQLITNEMARHEDFIAEITDVGEKATELVQEAESELHKARERSNSYQFYLVFWFIGLSFILLFLDWCC